MIPDFDVFDFNNAVIGELRRVAQIDPRIASIRFHAPLPVAEAIAAMPDAEYVRFVSGYLLMARPYPMERPLANAALEDALIAGWSADWMAPYAQGMPETAEASALDQTDAGAADQWHTSHTILGLAIIQRLARQETMCATNRCQLTARGADAIAAMTYEALIADAIAGRVGLRPTAYLLHLVDGGDTELTRARAVMQCLSTAVASLGFVGKLAR